MRAFILTIFALFSSINLFSKDFSTLEVAPFTNKLVNDRLTQQIILFPQEKIYLQLDKPYYTTSDTIWLRANMVNASLHTPYALSRYIYIELINDKNTVITRQMLRPDDQSQYFGQFSLNSNITPGWYSIRAYTNHMKELDENYFFRKPIYIGSNDQPTDNEITTASPQKSKTPTIPVKVKQKVSSHFDVQFFPEGGQLISGNTQNIAFKAIGENGLSADINGKILDEQNRLLATFKSSHQGMGVVSVPVQAGKTYTAVCFDNNGDSIKVQLPESATNTCALAVNNLGSKMTITILRPKENTIKDTLLLIGSLRGLLLLECDVTPDNNSLTISKDSLKAGVTQFLLIDKKGQIMSERIIYNSGYDKAQLGITLNKATFAPRDSAHASVSLKNSHGLPVEGNFAISVTNDNDVKMDSLETTIESYLLLQSDLKGYIENPNQYFRPNNKEAPRQLDLLMMTQGWKRYDQTAALAGTLDIEKGYKKELGPSISGRILGTDGKGIPNYKVIIIPDKKISLNFSYTDFNGNFLFPCGEFPDSVGFLIQAEKKKGYNVKLSLNRPSFPAVTLENSLPHEEMILKEKTIQASIDKDQESIRRQNGRISVSLKKVEITTKKLTKNESIRQEFNQPYTHSRNSFNSKEIENDSTIYQFLLKLPNWAPDSGSVKYKNATPVVFVDFMRWDMGTDELFMSSKDVLLLDLLLEGDERMGFAREFMGRPIICIYLKPERERIGTSLKKAQALTKRLGYTTPAEFYVPKYNIAENKQNQRPDLRSTIFWKPNVKSDTKGKADFEFYTSDDVSTYTLTAEGITSEGEIIRYQEKMNKK